MSRIDPIQLSTPAQFKNMTQSKTSAQFMTPAQSKTQPMDQDIIQTQIQPQAQNLIQTQTEAQNTIQSEIQNQSQVETQAEIPTLSREIETREEEEVEAEEEKEEEQQQKQNQQENNQSKTPNTRKRRTETRILTETSTHSTGLSSSVKTSDKSCDRQLRKRLVRVSSDTDLATLKSSFAVHRPSQSHITPSRRKPTIYREYYIKQKPKTSDVEMEMKVEDNFRYKFHWKVRSYLTQKYIENRYPNKVEMEEMAAKTKLQFKQIMMWFKDMRRKNHHTNPTKFNSTIVNVLLKYYNINKYPTHEEIEECAKESGIKPHQVVQWFGDRRYRCNHTQARARYPKEAIEYMNEKFIKTKNPTSQEIEEMAQEIDLTKNQIYTWFKIKRKKNGINSKQTE